MDIAAEGREEQIRQRESEDEGLVQKIRIEYAKKSQNWSQCDVIDASKPEIDVEFIDESFCCDADQGGIEKGGKTQLRT